MPPSAAGWTVRAARQADIEAIIALEEDLGHDPVPVRGSLNRGLPDPDVLVLVSEVGEQVIGWVKAQFSPGDDGPPAGWVLGGVQVRERFRRRGVGAELTRLRLTWISGRASQTYFCTNACNTASQQLHARFGFGEVSRGPSFYSATFDGGTGVLFRARLNSEAGTGWSIPS